MFILQSGHVLEQTPSAWASGFPTFFPPSDSGVATLLLEPFSLVSDGGLSGLKRTLH